MLRPTASIRLTALVVTTIYSLVVYLSGLQIAEWGKVVVAGIPTAAVAATILWDIWVWRLPFIQGLTRRPDLRGLWSISLMPHPASDIPEGGNKGPIEMFLEVRQSYWSIHLRMYSRESGSKSTAATWLPTFETAVDSVAFIYANTPKMSESHRSMRSSGSCSLEPASLKPTEMLGTYFTDRFTKGDLTCHFVDRSLGYPSFEAAQEAKGS